MTASQQQFRSLFLSGGSESIGYGHGSALADEIDVTLQFYRGLFQLEEAELLRAGSEYGQLIESFNPAYALEIRAMADACGQDERLLFALNSRSELFNRCRISGPGECTVVHDAGSRQLGQNWDWSSALEALVVDLSIQLNNGHRIRMLTEPGIIGKIGMNSAGLGACLNILATTEPLAGLPVHVLLRALLECDSLEQARAVIDSNSTGKASHVLLADADGEAISVEFHADRHSYLKAGTGCLLHTNHYLADEGLNEAEAIPSTRERYREALAWSEKRHLVDSHQDWPMQELLSNQSQAELSVCKPYTLSDMEGFGPVGTVFTVLMDLGVGAMGIRKGPYPERPFYWVAVSETNPSQPAR